MPFFGGPGGDSRSIGAETHTMPIDLQDAETGGVDLLFADDLQGTVFRMTEAAVYTAEEVRDEVGGDVPKFGKWIPVETEDGDAWAVAVGELVEELKRYENPLSVWIEVTRCQKSGTEQTDPYEVNVETVSGDETQAQL